jgi:hypothetical protein
LKQVASFLLQGVNREQALHRGDQVRGFEPELVPLDEPEDRLAADHRPQQAVVALVELELARVQLAAAQVCGSVHRLRCAFRALFGASKPGFGARRLLLHRRFQFLQV